MNLFLHWGSHIRETSRFLIFTSGIAFFCTFAIFSVYFPLYRPQSPIHYVHHYSSQGEGVCEVAFSTSTGGTIRAWTEDHNPSGWGRFPANKSSFAVFILRKTYLSGSEHCASTECCKLLCWEHVRFATGKVVYIPSWVPTLFRNADLIKSLKSTTCTRTDQNKFPCSSSVHQNLQAARKIRIENIKWRKVRWFVGLDLTALNSC